MTLGELIASCRDEARDTIDPLHWSDETLTGFANEAQREACRRSELLIDSTTADICTMNTTDALIALDALVVLVRRVKVSGSDYPLAPLTVSEMDASVPGWEADTGKPNTYVIDYQSNHIRLYPAQAAAVDVTLTVQRLPLAAMADVDADSPEIREEYHDALVQWMLYRGYSIQDADTFDPNKAVTCLRNFENEFGRKKSARNEAWQRGENNAFSNPLV